MLDITGVVDLISTGIQGLAGVGTRLFSGKSKPNGVQKGLYDNALEIMRDISPSLGEAATQWFYGKKYTKENLRDLITKAVANIDFNETQNAQKLEELRSLLRDLSSRSSTIQREVDKNRGKIEKQIKTIEESQKAAATAKGKLDDASTSIYENKNVLDIEKRINDATKQYYEEGHINEKI